MRCKCWICSDMHPPPPGYHYAGKRNDRLVPAPYHSDAMHAPIGNYFAAVSAESWHSEDCAIFERMGKA